MYPENNEISSRLEEIVTKIVESSDINEWEFIEEIYKKDARSKTIDRITKNQQSFYGYQNSLKLAFLLLNEKSEFSQIFWKSYALTYQVTNNSFVDDLEVKDVKNIVALLENESKKNKAVKKTLKRFKNFISQNGLLRTISKTQIEALFILETFGGFGAKAVLSDSNNSLDSIIYHGKSMLTKIIFNIYGLRITSGLGTESHSQSEVLNEDIKFLIRKDLLEKASEKHLNRYKKVITLDLNKGLDRDYKNAYFKSEELVKHITYRGDIENDLEAKPSFDEIFLSIYKKYIKNLSTSESDQETDLEISVSDTVSFAIEILRELVKARVEFFDGVLDFTPINSLALITGLSNTNSIKNVINNGEIEIKKEKKLFNRGINQPTKDSAMSWALDKKRKYKINEPIYEKPIRDIDFSYLSNQIDIFRQNFQGSRKNKLSFNDSDRFARTNKKITNRVVEHNKDRWEWIGKGKTFKELNEKNSTYRKNIKRKTYQKNKSPITQDILYDLNSGYIKQIN